MIQSFSKKNLIHIYGYCFYIIKRIKGRYLYSKDTNKITEKIVTIEKFNKLIIQYKSKINLIMKSFYITFINNEKIVKF